MPNGSAPVEVTNVPLPVSFTQDNPARQPIQVRNPITVPDGSDALCVNLTTVPANKPLAVEYVSGFARPPVGTKVRYIQVLTTANGTQVNHYIQLQESGVLNEFNFGQVVKFYADPNTVIEACFGREGTVGVADAVLEISGHLVDI